MKKSKKILIIVGIVIFVLLVLAVGFLAYRYYSNKQEFESLSKLYFSDIDDTQQIGKAQTDVEYNLNCSHSIEYPVIGKDEIDNQIKDIVNKLKEDFVNMYKDENVEKSATETLEGISYFQYVSYETYLAPDNKMSLIFSETQEVGDSNIVSEKVYTYNFDLNTGKKLENTDIFKDGYKSKISEYLKKYFTTKAEYKDVLLDSYEDKISDRDDNLNNYAITNDKIIVYFDKYDVLPGNFGIVKVEIPYSDIKDSMKINIGKTTNSPGDNTSTTTGKYEDVNEMVYAQAIVKVRESDSTQSKELGILNIGDEIKRVGIGDNGWSKVEYNNTTAYVSTTYLSDKKPEKSEFTAVNETVYAIAQVHVREEYNTNAKIITTLSVGDSIKRTGKSSNGWSKVEYNGAVAYVYSSYLSTTKPNTNTAEIPVNTERNIDPSKPMVALTFDDGPNPNSTPMILNTLKKYNCVATFFDLGTCMANYPSISKQEEAMGCEVGSHTYGHKNLNTLSAAQISADISKAEKIFENTLGHKPPFIRTPYGNANATVKATLHYPLINWDVDTLDWKSRNANSVLAEIHKYSNLDGRVILMHSIYKSTGQAVETLVPELVSKGYQLVTVSELAKYRGVTLQEGKTYYDFIK